jgi:CBS domain-containing protein
MDNPDASPAVPEGAPVDWRALLGHKEAVQAAELTDAAFDRFKGHRHEFIAVLEGDRAIGICARREIGMLLGGRYGYALHARRPVRAHMAPSALCISEDMSAETVLTKVFTRKAETFYDDVVLVDGDGAFVGLISVHALVRLQTSLREAHVRQIDIKRDEIAGKMRKWKQAWHWPANCNSPCFPGCFPPFLPLHGWPPPVCDSRIFTSLDCAGRRHFPFHAIGRIACLRLHLRRDGTPSKSIAEFIAPDKPFRIKTHARGDRERQRKATQLAHRPTP